MKRNLRRAVFDDGFNLDLFVGDDVVDPRMHEAALVTAERQLEDFLLRISNFFHQLHIPNAKVQRLLLC